MAVLSSFFAWVNSIPPVIWSGALGAVIASGISYIGVRSANSSSLKRLHAQHQYDRAEAIAQRTHDAQQKEEDRKAAIRREVYTKAVEEAHAVIAAIAGLQTKPLDASWLPPASDSDALNAFLKANAKVWLVAEAHAAHLSRELTNQMGELYLKTLGSANPIRQKLQQARGLDKQIVDAEHEVERIGAKEAENHEHRAGSLQAGTIRFQEAQLRLLDLQQARIRIFRSVAPELVAHTQAMFDDMNTVQTTIVQLVSALRKELHLPADEGEFLKQLVDTTERARAALFGQAAGT